MMEFNEWLLTQQEDKTGIGELARMAAKDDYLTKHPVTIFSTAAFLHVKGLPVTLRRAFKRADYKYVEYMSSIHPRVSSLKRWLDTRLESDSLAGELARELNGPNPSDLAVATWEEMGNRLEDVAQVHRVVKRSVAQDIMLQFQCYYQSYDPESRLFMYK